MSEAIKVVINLSGETASVGIQRPDCDPYFSRVEGDLAAVLGAVPGLVEQARQGWEASARYPVCQTQLTPPAAPAATQRSASRSKPAPQASMF
jgi:hypothetical protein